MNLTSDLYNATMGFVIGDIIGVPYEFKRRGTFICNAIKWMTLGKFTNHGYKVPFDVGNSCRKGILALMSGIPNKSANDQYSNGNGGLMRIPTLAFLHIENDEELLDYIKLFNECSHNHEISNIGCLIYIRLAEKLMRESRNVSDALSEVVSSIDDKYKIPEYTRIWSLSIIDANIDDVASSGFVVDTLEAAIWCCANNSSYESAILSAVNLGDDTDTVAALTGFLSGMYHGGIPEKWINNIRNRKMVEKRIAEFEKGVL